MANLSAPTVSEPLYDCAETVVVTGYVPGATLKIFAGAAPIGGGMSFSASGQVFAVTAANMVAGVKISATQTLGADTSPPSPEVVVQAPLSVDAPVLNAPLLECAHCVRVDGMLPGLRVQVRDGAAVVGQSPAAGAAVHVGVSPAFVAGHSISARQMHCGNPGPDTPGMTVGPSKERRQGLPAPEVDEPLFACQQAAAIYGCTPGCQADLFVGLVANASACCAGAAVSLWVSGGLVQGASITARQSLCGNSIQSPMSPAVLVQPATNIPRPAIWPPLYEGDTNVAVAMTVSGETVTLKADSTQIGMGGAGGGNAVFNVDPPLLAGQHVVATVELCAVKKDSLPLTVLPRPVTIPPPKILKPLNACSLLVNVVDCIAGAEVRVFAEAAGNKVLLGVGKAYGIALTVSVTPALKVGWSVTATQKVGRVTSPASAAVGVQAAPPPTPASLATPIYACARCVLVKGTLAGARVDVFQNNVWVGGANAAGTVTHVELYPGLGSDTTIIVTQTVCGKASKATSALTKAGPEKIAPPKLLPAYSDRAYVEAGGLVPGAVVEVEETSVYHMVIGKQCVTDQTATIGLNLPLFVGARLRARQRLCKASEYSPTIVVSEPIEWPLGAGPFKAGFRLPSDIPISADVTFTWSEEGPCNGGTYRFEKPAQNKAVVYYPATADGANAAFAAGGPFPLIVYAHGRRKPACLSGWQVCAGVPTDTSEDYRQLSGIMAHLARWGFIVIAPDLSWLASQFSTNDWQLVIADAASYMFAANGSSGSPFQGQIKTASVSLMGHSSGGLAVTHEATAGTLTVDAVALLAPANVSHETVIANFAPKPVIVVFGTQDAGPFSVNGQALDTYHAAGAKKHLVTIGGADHFGYTDSLCFQADGPPTISQADQQKIAKAYLTAFFRRFLSGASEVQDYLTGARVVEELESFAITVEAQL